jgi:hypothetical protein
VFDKLIQKYLPAELPLWVFGLAIILACILLNLSFYAFLRVLGLDNFWSGTFGTILMTGCLALFHFYDTREIIK